MPQTGAAWTRMHRFAGRAGETVMVPSGNGELAAVLIGHGDARERAGKRFQLAEFAARAPEGDYVIEGEMSPEEAEDAALGWLLSSYRFDRYSKSPPQRAQLVPPENVDAEKLLAIAEGVFLARDLINTPATDMGPGALEAAARELAGRHGAKLATLVGEQLLTANYPMIHAVGRAAAEEPRLLDLTWGDSDHPKVTIVGKGVCFDTGGLDIKSAVGMRLMKKDMGGAANALALAHMVMARGLKIQLRVLIPAVENSISANAFRPGDVLQSRLGPTVEVGNTDAEGRLVLADALARASEEKPALLVDLATLTGAARVAMGLEVAPYFTNNNQLAAAIDKASAAVKDPVWRMPLYDAYDEDLKSNIADIDNAPGGGFGGAITAALFLRRFVGAGIPWAHFDIYGYNNTSKPGRPKGGECMAARALFALLEDGHGG